MNYCEQVRKHTIQSFKACDVQRLGFWYGMSGHMRMWLHASPLQAWCIFRVKSNVGEWAFLKKWLTALSPWVFLWKIGFWVVWLSPECASGVFLNYLKLVIFYILRIVLTCTWEIILILFYSFFIFLFSKFNVFYLILIIWLYILCYTFCLQQSIGDHNDWRFVVYDIFFVISKNSAGS